MSLRQQMQVFKDWVSYATGRLAEVGIQSSRLDSELILAGVLDKDRTYIHAHEDKILSISQRNKANRLLTRRVNREPLAYVLGRKEFYGHNFIVTPKTLIPRPESEAIIELLIKLPLSGKKTKLVDVGTGCGCLGITAKIIFPQLDVTLIDTSSSVLKIARQNAKTLNADVKVLRSDLLQKYKGVPDIIIANLPYVDKGWGRSPETDFEPSLALFSKDNGLYLIKKLITEASSLLTKKGCLILEADPCQHERIIKYAKKNMYTLIAKKDYVVAFKLRVRPCTDTVKEQQQHRNYPDSKHQR